MTKYTINQIGGRNERTTSPSIDWTTLVSVIKRWSTGLSLTGSILFSTVDLRSTCFYEINKQQQYLHLSMYPLGNLLNHGFSKYQEYSASQIYFHTSNTSRWCFSLSRLHFDFFEILFVITEKWKKLTDLFFFVSYWNHNYICISPVVLVFKLITNLQKFSRNSLLLNR